MEEFQREFLSGFAWLMAHAFTRLETDEHGRVTFMGLRSLSDEEIRALPGSARLAVIALRDSFHEVAQKQGGTGIESLHTLTEQLVPAAQLLNSFQSVIDEGGLCSCHNKK
jgi:hypothetical protein